METQISAIEKLSKQIEKESDFKKLVELFSQAATLVKETISAVSACKGKITEIIRDMDTFIEKELKC